MAAPNSDLRGLLHSIVNPRSNEDYVRDQQTLTNLFKEPEFYVASQTFAADRNSSQPERLLASVITGREMKNKWRSKALIPEARKPEVRERLFFFLEEPDVAIAKPQLNLLVSIARIEYPKVFPNLPDLLLNPLLTCISQLEASPNAAAPGTSTATVLLNTLWTINALVKEWRTVKLAAGQQVMQSLENAFVSPVGKVLEIWSNRERAGDTDWVISEAGRYAFKIMARFSQWHWGKAKNSQSPQGLEHIRVSSQHSVTFAPIIQEHRSRLLQNPPNAKSADYNKLLKSLIKSSRAIGKWWRVMIATDPKRWCQSQGATEAVGWWWSAVGGVMAGSDGAISNDDSDDNPYPKRFSLLGMLSFKDILPILAVDHPGIFTSEFILTALHLLVDKSLPSTSTDLEALEDEPEEWSIAENNDEEAWAFEFRPCAERVSIASNNACRHLPADRKPIEPEMVKISAEAEALPPNDLPSILRKESVYCAVGRSSRALATHGAIDFNAFLQGVGNWLGQGIPLHRILKRRVAWLIGQWVYSDEECAKLPLVWQISSHSSSERGESSDMAVNLTAAVSVKECVDLWELDVSYFLPYLEQTVQEMIKLIGEASTLDGKRYVNDAIGVVIERVQGKIMPYLPTSAQSIPGLWHNAAGLEGEWSFKASLVVSTTKIVTAAKESSGDLMALVIPSIEESLQQPAKDYFEEDGLISWQTALYNSVSPYQPSSETGSIKSFPGLLSAISENMDSIPKLLPSFDSYVMLDAPGIVQNFSGPMGESSMKALQTSSASKNATNVQRISKSLQSLVQIGPSDQSAGMLLQSGSFAFTLHALEDDKASGQTLAAFLGVSSRIAMRDPQIYLQLVAEQARQSSADGPKSSEDALDSMWRNFDYVGETRGRKAVAMAAGSLSTTGHTQALERLDGEFINIFLDVLGESQPGDGSGPETTVNHWKDDNSTHWGEIEHTPEGARRRAFEDADPAWAVPSRGFVMDASTAAQGRGSGPYWEKADAGARHSSEKFLSSN